MFRKKPDRQKIKNRARRSLNREVSRNIQTYVIDTSAVINKFLPILIRKGLRGKILVPNAVMAELENIANKGKEEGFLGLEEISKLHRIKQIKVYFEGSRPSETQIKFAKSGEIDALIREIAIKSHATLITADLVQAKSSQAYGLKVIFFKPKEKRKDKKFLFWKLKG